MKKHRLTSHGLAVCQWRDPFSERVSVCQPSGCPRRHTAQLGSGRPRGGPTTPEAPPAQANDPHLDSLRSAPTPGTAPSPSLTSQPGKVLPLQSSPRGSGGVTQRGQETGTLELGSPSQPQTNSGYLSVSTPTSRPSLSPPPHKSIARKLPACGPVCLGASCFSGVNQSHPEGQ